MAGAGGGDAAEVCVAIGLVGVGVGFHLIGAVDVPTGLDEELEELIGGGVDGEVVGEEVGQEGVEVVLGLSFEEGEGELGVEAVLEMVAGGAGFAGGGFGAADAGAVGFEELAGAGGVGGSLEGGIF